MPGKKIKSYFVHIRTNPLPVFLIKGFLFFALWNFILYPILITQPIHDWVIQHLVQLSSYILGWFYPMVTHSCTEIFILGKHYIHVGNPCDGIEIMGVFASIVLAFHSKWYHKLWFVITGCFVTTLLNIIRITGLTMLIYGKHIRAFDINHKYVFNTILFAVLLILFSLWTTKFGIQKTTHISE